jgi:biopolymer transport protein ExbD
MKIRGYDKKGEDIRLQMTPMIDIVFQLLVFFIMTYRVVAMEGDYNILMPAASENQTMSDEPLDDLLLVKLSAGQDRYIESIKITFGNQEKTFAGNPVPDVEERRPVFNALHNFVLEIVGGSNNDPAAASEIEAEIEIDYDLRYEDTVLAMEAISGYKREDGQIVKLIEKIKFRKAGE